MSTRKALEAEIYELMDDLDPSGKNSERMKKMFTQMDDKKFYQYMNDFFNDPDKNFTVAYEPLDNPVNMTFIERIARKHGVPMYERVYKPYITGDLENPPMGVHPVLVVDFPIKRLKQMVMSKSHTSVSNNRRDSRTGQVTGADKTARVTDVEAFSMIAQELYACAEEAYGPMADDTGAMYEMMRLIQRDGEVSLRDLPKDTTNRVTMNTIEYYILGSGLTTNMIEQTGYMLPITMKSENDKTSTIQR